MDPRYVLILAVAVVMGWYALGTWINVRRGEAVLRWLQGGLPRLGEKTTFRWLGSSVVELVIGQGKGIAQRAEVLLALRPRDIPWTMLFAYARRRSDILIVRIDLVRTPPRAFELADPNTWTGRMIIHDARSQDWESRAHGEKLLLAPPGMLNLAQPIAERLAAHAPAGFHRLGLRKDAPHFEIHLPFPEPARDDAGALFEAIVALAKLSTEPPPRQMTPEPVPAED